MSAGVQLTVMIAGLHLLALVFAVALVLPALRDRPDLPPGSDPGSDGGWGRGPRRPPRPPDAPRGGLPLPDAVPARARLRDHRSLADFRPRPQRRPAREPTRAPVRTESGSS
jgi:hypothetical protein